MEVFGCQSKVEVLKIGSFASHGISDNVYRNWSVEIWLSQLGREDMLLAPRGQGCCWHPATYRTALATKNYSSINVKGKRMKAWMRVSATAMKMGSCPQCMLGKGEWRSLGISRSERQWVFRCRAMGIRGKYKYLKRKYKCGLIIFLGE